VWRTFRSEPFSSSFKFKKGLDEFSSFRYGHTLRATNTQSTKGLELWKLRTLLLSIVLLTIMELKTVSSRTPASTAPLSTSAAVTLWRTESNLEIGVGIDPSLREFAAGNQISARGVRLLHYKNAGAAKSICGNRDAASRGFSPATKLYIR
jgi:hypothetical protein